MRLVYPFDLPILPYGFDQLMPVSSEWTVKTHYEVNHAGYIKKSNELLSQKPAMQDQKLALLLTHVSGNLFNQLAQHFNHVVWWFSMMPEDKTTYEPTPLLKSMMIRDFGSVQSWRDDFLQKALKQFGSGWCWLCVEDGKLLNITTANAGIPNFVNGRVPLLVCDLWEHAYFCDYTTKRKEYIQRWFTILNWNMAEVRLKGEDQIFNLY